MHLGVKLVVVGDSGVGKTCLLIAQRTERFPTEYVPQVFEQQCQFGIVDGKEVILAFWDTAGQTECDEMRPLSYPETDVFFVCFSVDNRASFENIESRWIPEVRHSCPKTPIILVACKADLRQDISNPSSIVTYEEGSAVANKWGMTYCETSALTQEGLKTCFDAAYTGFPTTQTEALLATPFDNDGDKSTSTASTSQRHFRQGGGVKTIPTQIGIPTKRFQPY